MKNDASLTYNVFLFLGDSLALIAGFLAAFIIRSKTGVDVAHPMRIEDYLIILAGLLPFWIIVFALLGLYNTTIYERRFSEVARLFVGSFVGLLFLISWDYMSLDPIFPAKLVPIYGFAIAFVLLVVLRNIARLIRTSLFRYGVGLTRVVLVGNTDMTRELLESLTHRDSGYKVLGVIGFRRKLDGAVPSFSSFQSFLRATPHDMHGIVQTELFSDEERNAEILNYAQENHVSYRFVPGNNELFVGNIDVELFRNSVPVIRVHHTALFGSGRIIKRLMDISIGGLAILIASPLFLLVALLELLSRNGSVLFTQSRLTRFNTPFKVYKFRTQHANYDGTTPEEAFAMMGRPELAKQYRAGGDALDNDPRITRLGKFLRATSLDELPQLWNVVKGDISLVGPRALISQEMQQYPKSHLILSVKSGLTGLAVVSGRRDLSFEERRKLDLYYVQNWSIWLDLVILLKTVRAVIFRMGAQ
ncbi:MAG TPA: sugar transferase [Candidatus Saccharibacteria bacterium]|nr:sugar transferase [Candidatus Saccharibacteria bacterium]